MKKYVEPKEITKAKKELKKIACQIRVLKAELKLYERNNLTLTVRETRQKLTQLVRTADLIHTVLRQHNQMKKMHGEIGAIKSIVRHYYAID